MGLCSIKMAVSLYQVPIKYHVPIQCLFSTYPCSNIFRESSIVQVGTTYIILLLNHLTYQVPNGRIYDHPLMVDVGTLISNATKNMFIHEISTM